MGIIVEQVKDLAVISPDLRLSIKERIEFEQAIIDLAEKGVNRILIDFGKTKYIDSSCLGVIAGFVAKFRETEGDIGLCSVNKNIFKILEMTNMHTIIKIYPDRDSALKDFK